MEWMDLKDFVRQVTDLDKDAVYHVDTMGSFSFFNTDEENADTVLQAFEGIQFNNRKIEVEISKEGRKRSKGGKKDRKKEDFSRSKGKGKGKKDRFDDRGPGFKKRFQEKGTGGKRRKRR